MSELAMEWWVPQRPDQVFTAFEDPFRQRRWYGAPPGGLRLGEEGESEVGEPFRMNLLDERERPLAQICRVLEVDPGRGLVMELTWEGREDYGRETTRVSFTLHPAEGGTRIEVRQGPFSSREVEQAHRAYWEANMGRLARVVSGEAVPCFEEFWEESSGFVEPLGLATHAVLAGLREAGAAPELVAQVEETLYTHLGRLPEETARVLGAVLRARLHGGLPGGGG
ncbi:putative transcriptional regulator, ArsR family [Cystobacter fuscus DSM 2262]|uniref:Transcriptional regulator, ArsR family n=1 Tax=Cystobacter fuscus (strain ATCC 25194 / DSM 2262 / NBRC 100088 / M29) TaxID=1242864 RepID=S9Q6E3_CYSF2|nr:SRPBCC domain-containing protein [Cystobacter fuscus]EPX56904.1 putative transcriptional regulator, ArsR family [Cystobacter fuscus DSM 2262]